MDEVARIDTVATEKIIAMASETRSATVVFAGRSAEWDRSRTAPGAGPVADTGPALGDVAELGETEDASGASRISARDDAGAANATLAKRTSLRIDLGEDEVEALVRLARQRGRGTEDFVADLVRREFRAASARPEAGPVSLAKIPRNGAAPGG